MFNIEKFNDNQEKKKVLERAILNKVFSEKEFDIQETEEPDFLVANKKFQEEFGVEVTELFINQSSARIKNY